MMADETEEERSERLRKFVVGVCDGRIFTSAQLEPRELRMSFMILALMEPGQMPPGSAIAWEYMDKAGPIGINGLPCFLSCHFMNSADWDRARVAIAAELERRETVKV
jgi:hypothetical protein